MLPINPKYQGRSAYTIPTNPQLVNLALNENFVEHADKSIPAHANHYFCDSSKLQELKNLLAAHCGANADNIMITNGSGQGLKLILEVFAAPTTRIGILYPNYPGFIHDAELCQGQVVFKPCSTAEEFHKLDLSDIDILYISNPNLPHGYYIESEYLLDLIASKPNVLFIIDEAYGEYIDKPSLACSVVSQPNDLTPKCSEAQPTNSSVAKQSNTVAKQSNNYIVVKTLSKGFGLAGMRVGYIIAPPNLLKYLEIAYDSKTLTHEAIQYATLVMRNRDYYMAEIRAFCRAREDLRQTLHKMIFPGARIYNSLFTDCPWFILQCEEPGVVCQEFAHRGFLVRDKSSEIPGAVRITFAPQYAADIIAAVKHINLGYDKIIFDLDGTMRATYKSPIEQFIVKRWPELVAKYSARIITNNCAPRETIMQMLAENGISNADVISPITAEMNPLDGDWFIFKDELYVIRYPAVFGHDFALAITSAKQINIVETCDTTPSGEIDLLPDVPLPHIGLLLKYAELVNPAAKINVIGKTSLILEDYAELRVLMIGDTDIDKEFAAKNNFDFFDVRVASLECFISCL
jgi:histidinol-phosphate/aromatic aminotransferase/cobyric acid decarboxylase-like protein